MKPVQLEAFIDPTPISSMNCSPGAMEDEVGGSFTIVIVACGGKLGAATVITVGTVAKTIINSPP